MSVEDETRQKSLVEKEVSKYERKQAMRQEINSKGVEGNEDKEWREREREREPNKTDVD